MALAEVTSGSQTATITTEHSLYAPGSGGKTYVLVVDLANMVAGDIVELRLYAKSRAADTLRVAYLGTFAHVQGQPIAVSLPIPAFHDFKATLKQTAGTSRAYPWSVLTLD